MIAPASPRAVAVDLDGTLLGSDGRLSDVDRAALEDLGARGIVRIVATGRSLHSFRRAAGPGELPIDYVVFSSGAGVVREPGDALLHAAHLEPEQVRRAAEVLNDADLPFMLHHPVPDNHRFVHRATATAADDFHRRLDRYRDVAAPLVGCPGAFGRAAQLLAIAPPERVDVVEHVRSALNDLTVIRATSPFDHASIWIEVFPPHVSKSRTTASLLEGLGIGAADVLAVGNDYNDEDLLDWAGAAAVVANAPEHLRARFDTVPSNDAGGVATAVQRWLRSSA